MKKAFYKDLELDIFDSVYEPREDSFLLADCLQKLKNKKVLDMGCGSGIQGIVAAKQGADVTAVDINEKAVECTKHNAERNNVEIKAFQSDLFSNVKGKFDIIVFNPPYLIGKTGKQGDAALDGRKNGNEVINRFTRKAEEHLKSSGYVLLLVSSMNKFKYGKTVKKQHIFFEDLIVKKIEKSEL